MFLLYLAELGWFTPAVLRGIVALFGPFTSEIVEAPPMVLSSWIAPCREGLVLLKP